MPTIAIYPRKSLYTGKGESIQSQIEKTMNRSQKRYERCIPMQLKGRAKPMKRLISLLLALLLAVLPSMALADAFNLSTLTDQELLELQKELEMELSARGLSFASGLLSGLSSGKTSSSDSLVWIPNSGSKYHSKSSCSNMKNPKQVTLTTAKLLGYTPCSKCNPPK